MTLDRPPDELINRYLDFYRWLVPRLNVMLEVFPGAEPTSWFRTEAQNMAVDGATYSQHLLAWAVDWQMPRGQNRDMVNLARELGMVGVDEGDHVHVQMYPAGVIPKTFFPQRISV